MTVEWREINPDYIVSSDGQVGSRRKSGRLKMMKPNARGGYLAVYLSNDNGRTRRCVHHLVAEQFLPPKPSPHHQINHKDGDKTNNRADNLEWVTPSENALHRYNVLGKKAKRGEAHSQAKITEAQAGEIRARCSAGELQKVVATDYGITRQSVGRIARGERWAWLDAR